MRFFIDFEATQPGNEIIAIGAVAENGATFHTLVKPQLSSISPYVSQLTHISQTDLDKAISIDEALVKFDSWIGDQEPSIVKCEFLSYGDDAAFLKATLPAVKDDHAFLTLSYLLVKIKDCSKEVFKFFKGTVSLINAFNYVQSAETKQRHNPLEDAIMLQKVYTYTEENKPLESHPYRKENAEETVKMPSGTFWCSIGKKKNKQTFNFKDCDEAIDWLIKNVIRPSDNNIPHRENLMKKIMTSIRTGHKYCNYTWGRNKEVENEL